MALLNLKDIGKIYVSDNNVAVGIRGVNLSFDRGEFVAITGKSGSGKSTLLNVISGMDSYEEGELYVDGRSTSHYLQADWEEYRAKYISFIFQDYNIIESFTVLQNVELALLHIEDGKERRDRALALIERVGLSSHVKQKGSQLSGGQKQRTVIARALAKDSPIILADEPTGNLDSATSKEIIELLHEVSKDKLLIMVTHNFEQVAAHATRHIRIFDGAVESDQTLSALNVTSPSQAQKMPSVAAVQPAENKKYKELFKTAKDGATLGGAIFTAKPKLSVFLCLLMLIAALGVFLITAVCGGSIVEAFQPNYMFHPIDGRLVVASQTGEVANEETVKALAKEYGAESYMRYDALLDGNFTMLTMSHSSRVFNFDFTYDKTYGDDIYGRYPTAANEVFLYVHIAYEEDMGSADFLVEHGGVELSFDSGNHMAFKIVGVKYFYDNNLNNQAVFTEDGFAAANALYYFNSFYSTNVTANVTVAKPLANEEYQFFGEIASSFEVEPGKMYFSCEEYEQLLGEYPPEDVQTLVTIDAFKLSNFTGTSGIIASTTKGEESLSQTPPDTIIYGKTLFVHPTLLVELMQEMFDGSYNQFSLFFKNNAEARAAGEALKEIGYSAVLSNAEVEANIWEVVPSLVGGMFMTIIWLAVIIFLAFFLNLCSRRALDAFKGDMAIMRSMGISVGAIKIGMYVRMMIALIPAYLGVILTAIYVYVNPTLNRFFTYLYAWQYAVMFLGLLFIVVRITRKQIGSLFSESVKKSLKGGNAA